MGYFESIFDSFAFIMTTGEYHEYFQALITNNMIFLEQTKVMQWMVLHCNQHFFLDQCSVCRISNGIDLN